STRGVARPRATDAASSEELGTPAEPLGLLSRATAGAIARGAGRSEWPNARYVINALANSMRSGVAGPTPVNDCSSQQLRELGDMCCNPPRLVLAQQLGPLIAAPGSSSK